LYQSMPKFCGPQNGPFDAGKGWVFWNCSGAVLELFRNIEKH
jgi:hypothetical protein